MVGEKDKKSKKLEQLSVEFDVDNDEYEDSKKVYLDKNPKKPETSTSFGGHDSEREYFPVDTTVSSPDNILDFLDAIRDIKSADGQSIYTVQTKGDTFRVFKDDENGRPIEVLNGNTKTCKMSSPLDQNVLNAYISAHQGKTIIVDTCKSKDAAMQLIEACNASRPPVFIKFGDRILEKLFDSWELSKLPLPVATDIEMKIIPKRQKL